MATVTDLHDFLGVNTHIDFANLPYKNLDLTAKALKYIGIRNLRDTAQKPDTAQKWRELAIKTGCKFVAYMPTGSQPEIERAFTYLADLYRRGLILAFEGPNEPDIAYALTRGMTIAWAKQFQIVSMEPLANVLHKPLLNISFGAGWSAANNWRGNYDKVGDMSDSCTYGNAHTYPNTDQPTTATIRRLNDLAKLAAPKRPVFTSEIGWDLAKGFAPEDVAKRVLQAVFGAFRAGNVGLYFYSLFDNTDLGTKFGLMNSDGSPRPAGTALHDLTTLLRWNGNRWDARPELHYSVTENTAADQVVLLDGGDCWWLAVWNETEAAHPINISFTKSMRLTHYRPLAGPAPEVEQQLARTSIMVTDEVKLVRVA